LRDRLIGSAIRTGYRDVLFHGRHPAYVLFIEMNPSLVDVNAHPAKLEVRFRDARGVHEAVFRVIEKALSTTQPSSEISGGPGYAAALFKGAEAAQQWPMAGPSAISTSLDLRSDWVRDVPRTAYDASRVAKIIEPAATTSSACPPLGYALACTSSRK
jgi:DNA mismatch repair protein MutL